MSTYQPNGRAHRALRCLRDGPATLDDLRTVAACLERGRERRKHYYVVKALQADGLILLRGGRYHLTEPGEDVLATLNSGEPAQTGVGERAFTERAA